MPYPLPIRLEPGPPPGCHFDEASHVYSVGARSLTSVTTVLNSAGFIDFSHVPRHLLQEAQWRGTEVHRAVHYFNENDLVLDSVLDEHRGYLDSAIAYLRETKLTPLCDSTGRIIGVEFQYWDLDYLLAGTVDLVAWDPAFECLVIVDWKTGEPSDVAANLQTAAYEQGLRRHLLSKIPGGKLARKPMLRRSVKLHRDGRIGTPHPYTDVRDWPMFLNALACETYRRNGMCHDTPHGREFARLAAGHV